MRANLLNIGLSLSVAVLLAAASPVRADIVSDGDFSNPSGGPTFTTVNAGSSFGGWTVTSGSVDLIGGYWQSPSAGGGSVDLDGNSPGGLSQSLNIGAGSYQLSFALSGNPDGGAETNVVDVSVGNVSNAAFSFTTGSNTYGDMQYQTETVSFTATGPTTLSFVSADPSGPYGPVIGAVSVSAVPLPGALPMFGAALVGVAGFAARRRVAAKA